MKPHRCRHRGIGALSFTLFLSASFSSQGAILVQELFDGIAGTPPVADGSLDGKGDTATSIGFTGTWLANNSASTRIFTASNFNTGTALPGLTSSNGVAGGVWNNTNNFNRSIWATRGLSSSIDFAATQTIYFSFRANTSGDTSVGIGLSSDADGSFIGAGLSWNNARSLATGLNDSGNAAYISYGSLSGVSGGEAVGENQGPYGIRAHEAAGSTGAAPSLIVGRITISATTSDTIDIKRYTVGDVIAADPSQVTWSVSDTVDTSMVASNLLLWVNGSGSGDIDAIRFGQSWSDVTGVVPEPSSLLCAALGAGLLFSRKRSAR